MSWREGLIKPILDVMHNWSTKTTTLRKDADKYTVWRLEQLINFGLDGAKLSRKELIKNWDKLDVDPDRKRFLKLIIWPEKRF